MNIRIYILVLAGMLAVAGCTQGTPQAKQPVSPQPSQPTQQPTQQPAQPSPVKTEPPKQEPAKQQPAAKPSPEEERKAMLERSGKALAAIKQQDWSALKSYIHPDKGVRFSPYTFIDVKKHVVLKADQLEAAAKSGDKRVWGSFDGSGEPIQMTFAEYYKTFVYKHDYVKAEKVGYNEMLGKGNTVNNIREVYPGSLVVDYHFSGFEKKFEGMDWGSLRLVYEKKGDVWYLVGIVNDQWTV